MVKHPENDLRPRLEANPSAASSYTRQRIVDSYSVMESLIASCGLNTFRKAIDVGCGAGFDTFAIAQHFDEVVATDISRSAIAEAQAIQRANNVSNVRFLSEAAEDTLDQNHTKADFIYCNLMSHSVRSRLGLIGRMAHALSTQGCLIYAEVAEGYAPFEIQHAIASRNGLELANRIGQMLNGFVRFSGFRFYFASTFRAALEHFGLEITEFRQQSWEKLPVTLTAKCRLATGIPLGAGDSEGDYLGLPDDVAQIRKRFDAELSKILGGNFTSQDEIGLLQEVRDNINPFAPFLIGLAMAAYVLPRTGWRGGPEQPVAWRFRRLVTRLANRSFPLDWGRLDYLSRELTSSLRAFGERDGNNH